MFKIKGTPVDLPVALLEAREEAHLSQEALALRLGVSTRSVQAWEAGRMPQLRHRPVIAKFLDDPAEFARRRIVVPARVKEVRAA